MKVDYDNPRVVVALSVAPAKVRKAFFKQIRFLAENLHHPSLRAKKYDESQDLWQAPYLGVVEVFMTSDGPMLEAIAKISSLLPYPRCVVCTKEFFERL